MQGSQGLQGTQGVQGSLGLQGIQGISIQGVQGLQGTQGLLGFQGIQGLSIQGVQGFIGFQGVQGVQGSSIQGIQGISNQGVQGLQGTSGAAGTTGISGITILNDTSTNANRYIVFGEATSGIQTTATVSSSKLTFNPSSGTVTSTIFTATSDKNLKTNIHPIQNPIEKINLLNGVTFNWKENNQPSVGVIAQEVEKIFPELIIGNETKTVNYNGLIALLIECIKNNAKEIESLKRKLQS